MKFEKLNDTKIRIILSIQDIESNNLSVENILSNSADSQKLLESMITKAEEKLGFKPEDSKLLIEATAPSNNECVFIITKVTDDKINYSKFDDTFIYKFNSFDDFISLCSFLDNFSYLCLEEISKNFSLIYYNNTYYLKLMHSQDSSIVIDYIKTLFEEFGINVSHFSGIDGILNEYGKIIFEKNAIIKCINTFNVQ